jgi:hypothetical protein
VISLVMALAVAASGGTCKPGDRSASDVADSWVLAVRQENWRAMPAMVAKDAALKFDEETLSPETLFSRLNEGELTISPLALVDRKAEGERVVDRYTAKQGCMPMPREVMADGSLGPQRTLCPDTKRPAARIEYFVVDGCIQRLTMTTI